MTLSDELQWRGFVNQTTYKDLTILNGDPITFYMGMDPSADSLTIGNLAAAMMVRHFVDHGHKAIMLVGGATGLIGDPDGKSSARDLKSHDEVERNKQGIAKQYGIILAAQDFSLVDNYDWFKNMNYLEFLRDVGSHVPLSQMVGREFVQSRLGEGGSGISYAEFSYALIQGYDFLHLYRAHGATLQLCGADQWGNCIAGVELIRRADNGVAHIWSAPLVINKATGVKFGKSEGGAVWLDPTKTTPTQFYQFWINVDDLGVEDYLKIYTLLTQEQLSEIMTAHNERRQDRVAQTRLAEEVTRLIHGEEALGFAKVVTEFLTGHQAIADASPEVLDEVRRNLASAKVGREASILETLVGTGLATSLGEARRLLQSNAIAVNGEKVARDTFEDADFTNGRLFLRRGKAFKDTVLIELN